MAQRSFFVAALLTATLGACSQDLPTTPITSPGMGGALLSAGGVTSAASADRNGNGTVCGKSTPKGWVYVDDNLKSNASVCPSGFDAHSVSSGVNPVTIDANANGVVCTDGTIYLDDDGLYGCDSPYAPLVVGAVYSDPAHSDTDLDYYVCSQAGADGTPTYIDDAGGACPSGWTLYYYRPIGDGTVVEIIE